MTTMTVKVASNDQSFLQSSKNFVTNYSDVSFSVKEQKNLSNIPSTIYTPKIENLLEEEARKNNLSLIDYLNYMIAYEEEKASVVADMKTINEEIREVNNGSLKLQTLDSLIDELDD